MNQLAIIDAYGVLAEPTTLKIQRLLPGPVERIWAYITDSELRRKWLAAGDMPMKAGAAFELVWRNDELGTATGVRPEGFPEEHRREIRIVEIDAPHRLVLDWGGGGDVSFELQPKGNDVLLTVTHRRIPDRAAALMIGAGWHAHLDLLVGLAKAQPHTESFWSSWGRLHQEYGERLPA
jgi:uncharacterized protein YndB with AHSA1/START domain